MPRQIHVFDPPERFVAGTVGEPGSRMFYLQATAAGRAVSVTLEKQQVSLLADHLGELLDQLRRRGVEIPAGRAEVTDLGPLQSPVEEDFRVAALALAWDPGASRVVVEAQAPSQEAATTTAFSDDEEGPDVLRVRLSVEAVRGFVARAERVLAAGRPPCPLCGLPMDPAGHTCPRQNGHAH